MDDLNGAEQKFYSRRGRPKKTDYRGKKKRRTRQPGKIQTNEERNLTERNRVKKVALGVEELKSRIPYLQDKPKRVSQEKVLRLTISYINYLRGVLTQNEEPFDFEAEVEKVLNTGVKRKKTKKIQKNDDPEVLEVKNEL